MALVLNEEQQMLQDSAKEFFNRQMPISELRALRDSHDSNGYSRKQWQEITGLGWPGITVAETYGGLEFGYMGLGVIMGQAGRTLAATPLFATCVLGANAIALLGSDSQKAQFLPPLVQGKLLFALALEEGVTHGPEKTSTTARRQGENYLINGEKTVVLDGHIADKLLIVTRTAELPGEPNGLSLFLVDPVTPGITISRHKMADCRNSSTVLLENVEVRASALVGPLDHAMAPLQDLLSIGQIMISAEILGSIQECFERTVEYIKQRVQFDAILGAKQALQHRAARMYTQIEMCKSLVLSALTDLELGVRGEALAKVSSVTKAKLSETFLQVSSEGVQMFGGIGMTDDEEIGFFLKRARTTEHILGDVRYHENRYADLLGL